MYKKIELKVIILAIFLIAVGCNNPKVISSTDESIDTKTTPSGIFSESSKSPNKTVQKNNSFNDDLHTVVVNEVLPTSRYVYLNVNEGDEKFWIATRSKDVKVGETYYYSGGLLKTNFESKEYNRVFEKVYLISKLVAANHGNNSVDKTMTEVNKNEHNQPIEKIADIEPKNVKLQEGSITISELVKNSKKYEGKTVQLTGVCTKINAGIMDRNWIHLKDGSDNDYDLVITSESFVPEGSKVTIKAVVTLNKDFGAGYSYDLILENGMIVR